MITEAQTVLFSFYFHFDNSLSNLYVVLPQLGNRLQKQQPQHHTRTPVRACGAQGGENEANRVEVITVNQAGLIASTPVQWAWHCSLQGHALELLSSSLLELFGKSVCDVWKTNLCICLCLVPLMVILGIPNLSDGAPEQHSSTGGAIIVWPWLVSVCLGDTWQLSKWMESGQES